VCVCVSVCVYVCVCMCVCVSVCFMPFWSRDFNVYEIELRSKVLHLYIFGGNEKHKDVFSNESVIQN
jgi:hypothetical protein